MQNLEEAHVSTIHGFCADLLRERPVEARVDPLFRVLTEGQGRAAVQRGVRRLVPGHLETPPEGVRRSLRRTSRGVRPGDVDEDGPMERLRRAAFDLAEWRDFRGAWTREPFDRGGTIAARPAVSCTHSPTCRSSVVRRRQPVSRHRAGATAERGSRRRAAVRDRRQTLDGLESQLIDLRRNRDFKRARKGSGPTYAKGVPRARVLEARDLLTQALDDFQLRADADLAALSARRAARMRRSLSAAQGPRRRARLPRFAAPRARSDSRQRDRAQALSEPASGASSSTSSRTPIRCRRSCSCCWRRRIPSETRWQHVDPVAGQAVHRRRSEAVDLSVPSRRRGTSTRSVCEQLVERGATFVELRKSFRGVANISASSTRRSRR